MIFLCISASAADAVAVTSNGIRTLLANGLHMFFKANEFLVMIQEVYLEILLIARFYTVEFLIILF